MTLTIADIARETGTEYTGADMAVNSVSTDTRELPEGCLFIALKGDNFDGHEFIGQALDSGAALAVAERPGDWPRDRVLRVKDTRAVLMTIARMHRETLPAKVVAITGSVGKTTTKEMTARVCEAAFKTLKTEKNLNNEIGLSKTILSLDESFGAAVLEMGSDGPGQISGLSLTAKPDIGIVTGIGVSHIEAFGSREGIFAEKMDICAGLADGSDLILCGDNDLLKTVERPNLRVLRYGIENADCHALARDIREYPDRAEFNILWDGKRFEAQIPALGRHNVLNALAAFSAGVCLGIPPQIAADALKNYRPSGMRQNIVVHNSYTVVEDCYNASPDSMRAALDTLDGFNEGRRVAVLSDMLELGEESGRFHFEIGEYAASRADCLLCTGGLSRYYADGARSVGMENAFHYDNQEQLFEVLQSLLKPGDVVWFKASRGMRLEQVIEELYKT